MLCKFETVGFITCHLNVCVFYINFSVFEWTDVSGELGSVPTTDDSTSTRSYDAGTVTREMTLHDSTLLSSTANDDLTPSDEMPTVTVEISQ